MSIKTVRDANNKNNNNINRNHLPKNVYFSVVPTVCYTVVPFRILNLT